MYVDVECAALIDPSNSMDAALLRFVDAVGCFMVSITSAHRAAALPCHL